MPTPYMFYPDQGATHLLACISCFSRDSKAWAGGHSLSVNFVSTFLNIAGTLKFLSKLSFSYQMINVYLIQASIFHLAVLPCSTAVIYHFTAFTGVKLSSSFLIHMADLKPLIVKCCIMFKDKQRFDDLSLLLGMWILWLSHSNTIFKIKIKTCGGVHGWLLYSHDFLFVAYAFGIYPFNFFDSLLNPCYFSPHVAYLVN